MTGRLSLKRISLAAALASACQTPERVYFEVPVAAASGGFAAATGGETAVTGGAPALPTGGAPVGGAAGGAPALPSGGASTAPAVLTPEQQFDVCVEYMLAQCERLDACGELRYEQCLGVAIPQCPHFFFASSAHATVDAIQQCRDRWQRATCDEIKAPSFPGCEFAPGDRKLGEPCSFNTQCQTARCDRSQSPCGRCVSVAGAWEPCGQELAVCGAGLSCSTVCMVDGGACGQACVPTEVAAPPATPQRRIGEACTASFECSEGYCDRDTWACSPSPPVGMPCAVEVRHLGRACAGTSVCDVSLDVPLCVNPIALGQPCTSDAEGPDYYDSTCQTGLACACTDRSCSTGQRQCSQILPPGAACDFAGAWCVEPTECRNGRCEPVLRPDPNLEACRP